MPSFPSQLFKTGQRNLKKERRGNISTFEKRRAHERIFANWRIEPIHTLSKNPIGTGTLKRVEMRRRVREAQCKFVLSCLRCQIMNTVIIRQA
jgi:hypothetical protein